MSNPKCPYCIRCDAPVDRLDYGVDLETFEAKGGKVITYVEVSAYCRECGMELYVPEINDMNKLSRDNAYTAAMKRERPKGEWITDYCAVNGHSDIYCSVCNKDATYFVGSSDGIHWSEEYPAYCPNCGAEMRKEANDDEPKESP